MTVLISTVTVVLEVVLALLAMSIFLQTPLYSEWRTKRLTIFEGQLNLRSYYAANFTVPRDATGINVNILLNFSRTYQSSPNTTELHIMTLQNLISRSSNQSYASIYQANQTILEQSIASHTMFKQQIVLPSPGQYVLLYVSGADPSTVKMVETEATLQYHI